MDTQTEVHNGGYRHRRDADDFAADIRAKKAAEATDVQPDGLHGATHDPDAQVIELAQAAANRLIAGAAWEDWVAVGRALLVGCTAAMREAHVNKPEGKTYAATFSRWLITNKLDKVADKATRSRLLELLDHIEAVQKWRSTLPANKQLELNHPRTVFAHWKRSTVVQDPNKQPKPSPVEKYKQEIVRLEQENYRLKDANGGNQFTSKDTPANVVMVLRATFNESKLKQIRALLGKEGAA
jgi:hypothetical protein